MSYTPLPSTVTVIQTEHKKIHDGLTFHYSNPVTLGSGVSQDYIITAPDATTVPHMVFVADGTAVTSFFLYEATDKGGTTLQTVPNKNRNSLTANTTTIHKGTTGGTTDGTLLVSYSGGSAAGASRSESSVEHRDEWMLKRNTKYLFRVTSGTAGNLCNVSFEWYEYTPT